VHGFPSTSFYFSAMNGNLTDFRVDLESRPGWSSFSYGGFDERAMPTTLLATRYYLTQEWTESKARVPFGFHLDRRTEFGDVYLNENSLPIGFVYERVIDRDDYLKLGPVDRQAAMFQGAIVEEGAAPGVPREDPKRQAVEVPFSVASQDGATLDLVRGTIERTRDDGRIVLAISPVTDAELYVEMRDFDNIVHPVESGESGGAVEQEMQRRASQPETLDTEYTAGSVSKSEGWKTPESPYYWDNRTQLVQLGYQRGKVATIGIEPERAGTLTFESLKVYALPMEGFPAAADALRANRMRDIRVGQDSVSGRVDTPRGGLLFLSIPFSSGWSATVDGEAVEVERANTGFIGIPVSSGEHSVMLEYTTPGLRAGLLIAALAAVSCVGMLAAGAVRRRRVI